MNAIDEIVIRAVAEERVVPGTVMLAKRRVAQLDAKAAALPASVKHVDMRQRREGQHEEQAKRLMHDAVWEANLVLTRDPRAPHGRCDACDLPFRHAKDGSCDHWLNRSQGGPHTRENGWRLCRICDRAKTDNRPNRAWWNVIRQRYCERAGIPFVPRREKP